MVRIEDVLLSRYMRTLFPFAAAASSQQEASSSITCLTSRQTMSTSNSKNFTRIKKSPKRVVISQITDETTSTSLTCHAAFSPRATFHGRILVFKAILRSLGNNIDIGIPRLTPIPNPAFQGAQRRSRGSGCIAGFVFERHVNIVVYKRSLVLPIGYIRLSNDSVPH
ncbi:hypothetical protein NA56DRAFT_697376 [Hyaloscypha hepaticicola]|uniref:Uncharacterized protein n=1 Tax=Hyaloscypha hepaticicola TaxID=2082293 RepID=A0A2J6QLT2_9HELO|nr:hypothetical protein NA56DRAFT_697376 [Hyaloscypha hepaticicola]